MESGLDLIPSIAFVLRDDWEQMKHAEESRRATSIKARKQILDEHGVRYTILNSIPGWMNILRSIIDFMHNFYMGTPIGTCNICC